MLYKRLSINQACFLRFFLRCRDLLTSHVHAEVTGELQLFSGEEERGSLRGLGISLCVFGPQCPRHHDQAVGWLYWFLPALLVSASVSPGIGWAWWGGIGAAFPGEFCILEGPELCSESPGPS